MCGRFSMVGDVAGIAGRFGLKSSQLKPRYNIAPTQNAPVIIWERNPELKLLRWGLIPSWAKEETIGNRMINARAETLLEKPSFKRPLQRKRCLVLADGYYEWKKGGRVKAPYRFVLKGGEVFGFAGLWDTWVPPEGQPISSFTIVTTIPNELAQSVHDRMPAILSPENYAAWVDPEFSKVEILQGLLRPYPANEMRCYPVATLVNDIRNDDVRCVEPLSDGPRQGTLL